MVSKVKHRLNIFQQKNSELSKYEFTLVEFMKLDKVVTIYRKIWFNKH